LITVSLKARFLTVRKEIHNHYTDKWKTVVSKVKVADGEMVGLFSRP
jgi:hypothetical protein